MCLMEGVEQFEVALILVVCEMPWCVKNEPVCVIIVFDRDGGGKSEVRVWGMFIKVGRAGWER